MNTRTASLASALLLALSLGGPALAGGSHFADPLDTPPQVSPLAARGLFNGLALAGERVVAVGQRGHVLYSDDGGQQWTQARVPLSSDLTAVHFPTPRDGWAVGQDGVVLVTHDAGASWVRQLDGRQLGALLLRSYAQNPPAGLSTDVLAGLQADAQRVADEGPDKPFLDVYFEDAQRGWIVGAFNLLLRTEDGGASWQPWMHAAANPRALHLYAIRAIGSELYLAGEQGLLRKWNPAQQQFEAIALPYQGTLFGLVGDAQGAVVYGLRGTAFRSIDQGRSWAPVATGSEVTLTAATRSADGSWLLANQTGQVLRTRDAAASLSSLDLPQRLPASAVLALPGGSLILAGPRGLQRIQLPQGQE